MGREKNKSQPVLDFQELPTPLRVFLFSAVLATLVFLTAYTKATATNTRASFPEAADTYYLPPPVALRLASLGHIEAMADLVWVKAVLYFGEKVTTRSKQTYLRRYLDTVIQLNPRFRRVYQWAGAVMIYNARRITNDSVWDSIHYLRKGHNQFPKNWRILFSLASNYLYELKTTDPEMRDKWRRIGADYLWKAANLGGGPDYLHSMAAKVWSEQGRFEVAHKRLREVYLSTENPKIRESVRRRMEHLLATRADQLLAIERLALHSSLTGFSGGAMPAFGSALELSFAERHKEESSQRVEKMSLHRERFEKKWKAQLPYAPADLYILLGPRPDFK